ncbi:MAG: hypothetical protein F4Z01_04725 [Gammaproteobacteria bacterium]|nr:hypothetical protein [Gammaproteobacteria bacterium]MYF38933.1 hypothetical protein [Gammaproteobacteria bacterium]
MRIEQILTSFALPALVCFCFSTVAEEAESETGLRVFESSWFSSGAAIQDLRERSTKTFELLDENDSGSITFDEIDLSQMESDYSKMTPEELRQHSRRSSAIHNKFMSWSAEINEFEVVDTNGDGVWDLAEYEERHKKVQSHRLELGLEEWDADENGAVELHEFNSHLDELELYDENADGTVSREEAFKSENDKVISDVLMNKLMMDEMVWASFGAAPAASAEVGVEYKVMHVEVEKSKE